MHNFLSVKSWAQSNHWKHFYEQFILAYEQQLNM